MARKFVPNIEALEAYQAKKEGRPAPKAKKAVASTFERARHIVFGFAFLAVTFGGLLHHLH